MRSSPSAITLLSLALPYAAGYFFSYLLRTVNAVISPELQSELQLSAGDLGLLTSAYFLSFAAAQIPVGILLDRFGSRRVDAALLVIAALGALWFGLADNTRDLFIARCIIGLGVSAALMAALKAAAHTLPPERMASFTGLIMAAGGLGAITASVPLEQSLPLLGWRGVFFVLSGLILISAAIVFWRAPENTHAHHQADEQHPLAGLWQVLQSRILWRFVPSSFFIVGGFMALQGLWAVPWLMQVNGMTRAAAAQNIFWLNLAVLCGQLTLAMFATRWAARGISATRVMAAAQGVALLAQLLLIFQLTAAASGWFLYGLVSSTGALMYSVLAMYFPPALSGRVMTTINLVAFVGAFCIQWAFGVLIDLLTTQGTDIARSYQLTYALLWLTQLAAFVCLWRHPVIMRIKKTG